MRFLISGGTGLIGHALAMKWLDDGHDVLIVTRSRSSPKRTFPRRQPHYVTWSDMKVASDLFRNLDAVVNLAGESINQRWIEAARNRITASRLVSSRKLLDWARQLEQKLPLYIGASGISIYGSSLTGVFDESSSAEGKDFLSEVVRRWEAATDQMPAERIVKLRIAPVLARASGAFPPMLMPFKMYAGGPIGSGKQPFSWIHLNDIVRLIDFIVTEPSIEGVVNASAPENVTNEQFGRSIAKVYNRPYWFPVPAWVLKMIFGEMSMLLLEGQRVYPAKALEYGFTFQHGTVESALRALHADPQQNAEAASGQIK